MKRLISMLLCVVMIASAAAITVSANGPDNIQVPHPYQTFMNENSFKLGDANSDGERNAFDSLAIKAKIAGVDGYGDVFVDAADINGDGEANARDVMYMKACFAGAARFSDFESSKQVYSFRIAGNSISDYDIVLPEGTTYDDNVYMCYELMSKYTEIATGVKIPLSYGESTKAHGIYYHSEFGTELGDELGRDGYKYEVKNGDLHIYGTYRGNMYATYLILEDYLGFNFFASDRTYSVKKRCVDIKEGTEKQFVPLLEFRNVSHTYWGSTKDHHYLPRKLNTTINSYTSGSLFYGGFTGPVFNNAHSYWYYKAMATGDMPEEGTLNADGTVMTLAQRYYQKFLNGGGESAKDTDPEPCANNTDQFNLLYRGMLETVEMVKARGYDLYYEEGFHLISFSINDMIGDSYTYCTCSICSTMARGGSVNARTKAVADDVYANFTGKCNYRVDTSGKKPAYYLEFEPEYYSGVYVNFVNRAAKQVKEDHPGARVFTIIYEHDVPSTVKPYDNVVIMYCGNGCNNHALGSGECKEGGGQLTHHDGSQYNNNPDEKFIPQWASICKETGASLWFWYYPETYAYYLYDVPCVFNILKDFRWLTENGVSGIYYEGTSDSGAELTFEPLKAYLAAEVEWNPMMSDEEYVQIIKKYLKMYYGEGYEYIYQYMCHLEKAADEVDGCFYGAFDRVWDVFSKSYIAEHYEEMRELLNNAEGMRSSLYSQDYINRLKINCEFLGLSALYDTMYTNGSTASKNTYKERYNWMYNKIKDLGVKVYVDSTYSLPAQPDYEDDPATQIYVVTERRQK